MAIQEQIKTWWISIRPFSFPASIMPVVFGSILAVTHGGADFQPGLFVLSVFAMVLLQAGANVWNDVSDFKKGIDREVFPVSGGVVRGLLTPRRALLGSTVLFGAGCLLGLIISYFAGWPVLILGIIGVSIGILYSVSSFGLKYHALGDLAVFLNFGLFGTLGAWLVQDSSFSWLPVFWSIPVSLLVVGILHANNWRDIEGDTNGETATVASCLGDKGSENYFAFLILAPYLLVLFFIALPYLSGVFPGLPIAFLITLLSFPLACGILRKSKRRHSTEGVQAFVALDGETAKLNIAFGVLYIAALLVDYIL